MLYKPVDKNLNFRDRELEVLDFWEKNEIFKKSVARNAGQAAYTFYDGPPTANGKPHIGHILTRCIKDLIPRYKTMQGYDVLRKAGWDTHGLPVELEVEKMLGLDGKEQIVCIARPGDSFNDVSIFDGEPSPFSAQAMGPVTVYGIDKGDVENILRGHGQVTLNVINVLAERIRYLSSLVEDLSFRPVIGRVAKILLEYAGNGGGNPQRLTQQEMAAMAGTVREVVARSIRNLESRGTLRLDRHRIVITDRSALSEIAGVAD